MTYNCDICGNRFRKGMRITATEVYPDGEFGKTFNICHRNQCNGLMATELQRMIKEGKVNANS